MRSPPPVPPWQPTPWWHVARWFGFSLRRYINHHPFTEAWEYGRPKKVARQELARRYDEQTNVSGTGQQAGSWHRPNVLR